LIFFDTMPSSPSLHTAANISAPLPSTVLLAHLTPQSNCILFVPIVVALIPVIGFAYALSMAVYRCHKSGGDATRALSRGHGDNKSS
jgi:hypothetical protein